jgi:predicted transposase YdaD
MGSVFDLIFRRLAQSHPEQLLLLLFGPDAPTLLRTADSSLPQSERRADTILVVEARGERFAVEVEVQAQPDPSFTRRLLDYAVRVHLREGLPVLPVVLFLFPEAENTAPPYTFGCAGRHVLSFDFQVVRLWEVDFSQPALQAATALLPLSVMETRAGPERVAWAEARLRQEPSLSSEERLDLLVVLGTLASRRFGLQRLSQSLRSIMLDSPFWEEQRAREQVRVRARTLMIFASTRGLALPPDAEQRLAQLDAATLEALIKQAFTAPDAAATALLAATRPPEH